MLDIIVPKANYFVFVKYRGSNWYYGLRIFLTLRVVWNYNLILTNYFHSHSDPPKGRLSKLGHFFFGFDPGLGLGLDFGLGLINRHDAFFS